MERELDSMMKELESMERSDRLNTLYNQSTSLVNTDKLLIDGLYSIDPNEYATITKHMHWLRKVIVMTENIPIGFSIAAFKPTKNLIRTADSHSSWSMTDKEINPSHDEERHRADLNLQRFQSNHACNYPLIYVNKAFSSITQYSREEVMGKNCNFLQGEIAYPELTTKLEMSTNLSKGEISRSLITNFKKDGTKFRNLLTLFPITRMSGKIVYYVGIQCDVTSELTPYDHIMLGEDIRSTIPTLIDVEDNFPVHHDLDNLVHAIGTWKTIKTHPQKKVPRAKKAPHPRDTILHDNDKFPLILDPDKSVHGQLVGIYPNNYTMWPLKPPTTPKNALRYLFGNRKWI